MHSKDEKVFNYGIIAETDYFTNRTKEIKWLTDYLKAKINCTIISPRRWGKSSLVKEVANKMQNKKTVFCFIDLFNVRTEKEFIQYYTNAIFKATFSKPQEVLSNAKNFLKLVIPKLSFSPDPSAAYEISFDFEDSPKTISEILDLPNKIAKQKNIHLIICIDEFQNISNFEDGMAWQKKLRAHWQKHQFCNYVLYGSKRHMMLEFFTNSSMPFYKFGSIYFLEKIETSHWIHYIQSRFLKTNKQININLAEKIAVSMDNHPYFVQQMGLAVWLATDKVANDKSFENGLQNLLDHQNMLYQRMVEYLTNTQINFLKALCNNETQLSSKLILNKYNLGTSANIIKIKATLEKLEIIDLFETTITFNDPLFKYWLMKNYFKF